MKKKDLPLGVDLSGKVAVITGAGGVICSTLAKAVAAAGAKVALLDLSAERAQQYAAWRKDIPQMFWIRNRLPNVTAPF